MMTTHTLVGILLGISSFALLIWFAGKIEREKPGPEGAKFGRMLRVIAYVDLVMIPLLMHHFGQSAGR